MSDACENTDREIWRGPDEGCGDYYADSIHVTKDGDIGINCGGTVIVLPVREWRKLADTRPSGGEAVAWDMVLVPRADVEAAIDAFASIAADAAGSSSAGCPEQGVQAIHSTALSAMAALDIAASAPASSQPQTEWRDIESAPKDGSYVLLDLGETIPDVVDARVGQFISEHDGHGLGESLPASGGWIIWNDGSDWFVVSYYDAHGWMPLPVPPISKGSAT
jgi:hypothetical protein